MNFWISLVLAALSGMGVGGGGLFALYLKLTADQPQIQVQALNLLFFLVASSSAVCVHLFARKIYFLPVAVMISAGIAGSLLGSSLAFALDGAVLGKIFGLMLILTALYSFFKKSDDIQKK